ncbi:hypothetical protein [Methylacidiphilum sp. Yel]|uniref:hypothetical protein n=1 Tax=Methylacidiphilum sp. Yel TaxID=1847730 RepID=UPI001ABCEE80|nr:hypothetical protein [Methylacidiphilum sp. Yel]
MKNLFKLSSILFVSLSLISASSLYASESIEIAKKKAKCGCADNCAKKENCAVHKGKDCDCS